MRRRESLTERLKRTLRVKRALQIVWAAAPSWAVANVSLVVLQAALPLLALYLSKLIVDAVAAAIAEPSGDASFGPILLLIGLAALVGLAMAVTRSLAGLVAEAQGHLVTDHVLNLLHQKSVEVDLAYYEDPRYYDTLHRAQRDAPLRPTRILNNLVQMGQSGLTAIGLLALLVSVHWLLAAVLFAAVVPGFLVRLRYAGRNYRLQTRRASTERHAAYLSAVLTGVAYAKEVRLFDLGALLSGRFRDLRSQLRKERLDLSRGRTFADTFAQLAASLAVFGSYAFIAYQTFQGALTLGDLVMYFGAVQRGQSVLGALLGGLGGLYEDNLFLSNMDDFLELEPRITAPLRSRAVPQPIQDRIVLDAVSFRYPDSSRPLLEEVDLVVRPGEMAALIGPNGSGKTTLVKLLCRFYDPISGSITVDGIPLRDLDPAAWRHQISVVYQDYARYYMPARDNIWFGDVRRPVEEGRIVAAARTSGADDVIRELRHGYQTILGKLFEEGEELSIGEWQKVALARAFLSDAQLIIVDEPTSALDADAEAAVFNSLRQLVNERAVLVISHRFSTVLMADVIYVLDRGRIIESGSHEELMKVGGKYAHLYETQASFYRRSQQTSLGAGEPWPG